MATAVSPSVPEATKVDRCFAPETLVTAYFDSCSMFNQWSETSVSLPNFIHVGHCGAKGEQPDENTETSSTIKIQVDYHDDVAVEREEKDADCTIL